MANEATRTLSDAYGHVMHGDDAGSSAKVVWVVHPTNVPISGGGGGGGDNNGGGGKEEVEKSINKKKGNPQSPSSNKNGGNNSNSGDDYLYTQKFGKLYGMFICILQKDDMCVIYLFCMLITYIACTTINHNKYNNNTTTINN